MDAMKVNAQSLAKPLGFVVTGPGAGKGNISQVSLRGWDVFRRGVSINLAGGEEQKAQE
jgi:hypothetical protein